MPADALLLEIFCCWRRTLPLAPLAQAPELQGAVWRAVSTEVQRKGGGSRLSVALGLLRPQGRGGARPSL